MEKNGSDETIEIVSIQIEKMIAFNYMKIMRKKFSIQTKPEKEVILFQYSNLSMVCSNKYMRRLEGDKNRMQFRIIIRYTKKSAI